MELAVEDQEIGNNGERMIVANLWSYWAHLSIYRFALPFAVGRRVLEAGTGAGYGTAYLARHGATGVLGFEVSTEAVAYSRRRFAGDAVTYEVADLNNPLPVGDRQFGLVFSSNVFEHVGLVDSLAAECARVVAADGVVIVAVPPITSAQTMADDMRNEFHVHHIPPPAWHAKLQRFFSDVRCHRHVGTGKWDDHATMQAEIAAPAAAVTIRETDFAFPECAPDDFLTQGGITAVFVCRGPRSEQGPETLAERTPAAWREGEVAARLIASLRAEIDAKIQHPAATADQASAPIHAEVAMNRDAQSQTFDALKGVDRETNQLRQALAAAHARVAAIEASTSWRITAPARRLIGAWRRIARQS